MTIQSFNNTLWGEWIIAFGLIALVISIAHRGVLLTLARVVRATTRILFFPARFAGKLLVRILRVVRIMPRAALKPRSLGKMSVSAWSAVLRVFRENNEVEKALRAMPEGAQGYSFAEEEAQLARRGAIFKWIDVKSAYVPEDAQLSTDVAEIYHQEANRFFGEAVAMEADEGTLYEDAEGAAIITKFRARDRRCFYLLNEMRKVIDDNVRSLAMVFSAILYTVLMTELFFADQIGAAIQALSAIALSPAALGLVLCGLGALIMLWMYFTEYVHSQRSNGERLKNFLTRYLGRLSDRYRNAISHAGMVIVGDEKDAKRLSLEAQRWHKIVLWIAFRAFFIESYLRNIQYQIRRNTGYYIVFVPVGFAAAALIVLVMFSGPANSGMIAPFVGASPWFWGAYAALLLAFVAFLARAMNSFEDLDQRDWRGFNDFHVDIEMDRIIGKYAEEVGYWRNRVKGGERG